MDQEIFLCGQARVFELHHLAGEEATTQRFEKGEDPARVRRDEGLLGMLTWRVAVRSACDNLFPFPREVMDKVVVHYTEVSMTIHSDPSLPHLGD